MEGSLRSLQSGSLNAGAGHLWNRSQTPAVYQGSLASLSSIPSPVTLQAAPSIPTLVQPGPMLPPPSLMQTSTFLPPWIEQGSPRSTIEAPHAFVFHARPPWSASPSPQRQATWAAPMRVPSMAVANPCEATSGSPRQALMQPVRIVHPRSVPAHTMSPSQASSIEPRKQAAKEMCNILKVLVLRKMAAGFARLLRHTKEQELMDKGAVELLTQLNSYDELAHRRPGRVGAILSTALQTEGQRIASHCRSLSLLLGLRQLQGLVLRDQRQAPGSSALQWAFQRLRRHVRREGAQAQRLPMRHVTRPSMASTLKSE